MKAFEKWQAVEVLLGGEWIQGVYLSDYDDKVTALAHSVVTEHHGDVAVPDASIRAVPVFQAFGDDLPLVEAALSHYQQALFNASMGEPSEALAAVQRLHERAKRAMEVGR